MRKKRNEDSLFNENVSIWSQTNPQAAVFLPYADCTRLVFCKTGNGFSNLKSVVNGKEEFYHASDPMSESVHWFSNLLISDIQVIYVFGVGLGYAYEAAKAWLEKSPNHHLVFIEDNLSVIHRLFETPRGSEMLCHEQVKIYYFENVDDKNSPINELFWNYLTIKMITTALPYYETHRSEIFSQLQHKLSYDCTIRFAQLQEYLDYGIPFYRNFYSNMLFLTGASLGDSLEGKFKNIPAIICGAGPSLNKHIPLLKRLGDKALIFAGGSALNALNAAGIQPHLGAGIDPNPDQYKRLNSNSAFELPFLYRNRMEHRAFRTIHGPHLYFTGCGGYDTAEWYEKKFNIEGKDIDEGFNVVNFCIDIARAWGCNPIIFVGMDLAFTEMESYAEGIVQDTKVSEHHLLKTSDLDERALLKPDIYGKSVYTLWKWIAESQWIGEFAKEHAQLQLINATEGGIGFPGIPNEPLDFVAKVHLKRSYELTSRLHGEIQNHVLKDVTSAELVQLTEELRDSLLRCQEHLEILIKDAEDVIAWIKHEKRLPEVMQSGKAALAEIELADEPGYCYVLTMFNVVYSKVLNRDLRSIYRDSNLAQDWQKAIEKCLIMNKKLSFLRDVALANVAMIGQALNDVVEG